MALRDGLYDLILTEGVERLLSDVTASQLTLERLDGAAADYLVDNLVRQLGGLLEDLPGDDEERARRQLMLVNDMLAWLRRRLDEAASAIDLIALPPRRLTSVHRLPPAPTPPELGLAAPWLFTAGKGSPSLLQEIRRELATSDRVDILVSFITVSGVRKLQDVLEHITARGASHDPGDQRLRILTTTYTGATEARALDALARLPGCEVRVSLDGRRTRLHAKA